VVLALGDKDPDARATDWGAAAQLLEKEVLAHMPDIQTAIGKDEEAAYSAAPSLTFTHGGAPRIERALRGGLGPWDRLLSLAVTCNGQTQVETEAIWKEVLLALNEVAHGRAGAPGVEGIEEGSQTSANDGWQIEGTVVVRLNVRRAPPVHVQPVAAGFTLAARSAADDVPEEAPIAQPGGGP
jgi:hypothetical protein